jgi:hypothetical protein
MFLTGSESVVSEDTQTPLEIAATEVTLPCLNFSTTEINLKLLAIQSPVRTFPLEFPINDALLSPGA